MTNEERWHTFTAQLQAHIEVHRHCPPKNTALHNQIKYYRKKMKAGTLTAPQAQQLIRILNMRDMNEHTGGRRKKSEN